MKPLPGSAKMTIAAFAAGQARRPDGTPGAGDPRRIMD